MTLGESLEAVFGPDRVRISMPLAGYATFGIGGAADVLVETRRADEVLRALGARVERENGG